MTTPDVVKVEIFGVLNAPLIAIAWRCTALNLAQYEWRSEPDEIQEHVVSVMAALGYRPTSDPWPKWFLGCVEFRKGD